MPNAEQQKILDELDKISEEQRRDDVAHRTVIDETRRGRMSIENFKEANKAYIKRINERAKRYNELEEALYLL